MEKEAWEVLQTGCVICGAVWVTGGVKMTIHPWWMNLESHEYRKESPLTYLRPSYRVLGFVHRRWETLYQECMVATEELRWRFSNDDCSSTLAQTPRHGSVNHSKSWNVCDHNLSYQPPLVPPHGPHTQCHGERMSSLVISP